MGIRCRWSGVGIHWRGASAPTVGVCAVRAELLVVAVAVFVRAAGAGGKRFRLRVPSRAAGAGGVHCVLAEREFHIV